MSNQILMGVVLGLFVGYIAAFLIWIWSMILWLLIGKTDDPGGYASYPNPNTSNRVALIRLVTRSWMYAPFHPLPYFAGFLVYYGFDAVQGALDPYWTGFYIGIVSAVIYRFLWWVLMEIRAKNKESEEG